MKTSRYILDKSSKKFRCPECGKLRFVRFIDTTTGDYLAEEFGRCDREVNCGYFKHPCKDNEGMKGGFSKAVPPTAEPSPSFIPYEIFSQSRNHYQENNFVLFLIKNFGQDKALEAVTRYHIGTSKHWPGACVFWQIDGKGRIHSGKIMLYSSTGHRIKEPFPHVTWVHSALKLEDFNLSQCLFGEHLLKLYPGLPLAIVESEKSAIISSLYFPGFNWLAAGGLSNLSPERSKALKQREAVLFPDLKAFSKWNDKAQELSRELNARFRVSDLLEREATPQEREQGLDLADYLLRFPLNEFHEKNEASEKRFFSSAPPGPEPIQPKNEKYARNEVSEKTFFPRTKTQQFTPWDLSELEQFYNEHPLPAGPVKLQPWETIENVPLFVKSNLELVRAQNGNQTYQSYLKQLEKLREILTLNNN